MKGGGKPRTGVGFGGGEVMMQAIQGVGEDQDTDSTNTFHFQPRTQTNLREVEAEVKAGQQNTIAVEFLFYTDEEPSAWNAFVIFMKYNDSFWALLIYSDLTNHKVI